MIEPFLENPHAAGLPLAGNPAFVFPGAELGS
jgi:hypothetical protein